LFSAYDWLAALAAHIPNAGEHLVRHYGWYSTVNRGTRWNAQTKEEDASALVDFSEVSNEVSNAAAKRAWARLIKQVYEVDHLACPQCSGSMGIIVFIEQCAVIETILTPRHPGGVA